MKNTSFSAEPLDVTIESQKLLSCVARFQQRKESFGLNYTLQVLCGSRSDLLEEGHDALSTYGIGKDKDKEFWVILYNFLLANDSIEHNYIQIAEGHRRPVLSLNSNSWKILKGNTSVIINPEAWESLLIENQKYRICETNSYCTYSDNEEAYTDSYEDPRSEEYFINGESYDSDYESYDSFLADNDLDYGYLSDMQNYNEY